MTFDHRIFLMFVSIMFINAFSAWMIYSMIKKALDHFLEITINNRLCMTNTLYAAQQDLILRNEKGKTKANPPKKD